MHAAYMLAAIVVVTLALLLGCWAGSPWCRNVFVPWDCTGAAIFGGDGRHSISAYCGRHHRLGASWICGTVLYASINALLPDQDGRTHCDDADLKEFNAS